MGGLFRDTFPHFGLGLSEPKPTRVINRSGGTRVKGEIGMFDVRMTVATTWKAGGANSVFANAVTPTVPERGWAMLCLYDETVPNGQEGKAWIWHSEGLVLYAAGQDPISFANPISYEAGTNRLDGTAPVGASKVWAFAIDSTINRAAGSLMRANFNGIFGWGKA